MGTVSTIPEESPLKHILDKRSAYCYDPWVRGKRYFIVTTCGHSTC